MLGSVQTSPMIMLHSASEKAMNDNAIASAEEFALLVAGEVTDDWQERIALVEARDRLIREAAAKEAAKKERERVVLFVKGKVDNLSSLECRAVVAKLAELIRALPDEEQKANSSVKMLR